MEVEDGEAALTSFKEHKPDFVFMDIQMPVLDGLKATSMIRAQEDEEVHVPIIAITAHAMKGDREHFLEQGMTHIRKLEQSDIGRDFEKLFEYT